MPLASARTLLAPPDKPAVYAFGKLRESWSWALLPSPVPHLPFVCCGVNHFTLTMILDSCNPRQIMQHPAWCDATWSILRQMPVPKVASLIWKIGTNRLCLPPKPFVTLLCEQCGCPASLDHIVFGCSVSAPLWQAFDRAFGAVRAPSFELIFAGVDRRSQEPSMCSDTQMVTLLELLHIHHAWCTWWAYQHGSDVKLTERWPRRVMALYSMLGPVKQQIWARHPVVSSIVNEWRY